MAESTFAFNRFTRAIFPASALLLATPALAVVPAEITTAASATEEGSVSIGEGEFQVINDSEDLRLKKLFEGLGGLKKPVSMRSY